MLCVLACVRAARGLTRPAAMSVCVLTVANVVLTGSTSSAGLLTPKNRSRLGAGPVACFAGHRKKHGREHPYRGGAFPQGGVDRGTRFWRSSVIGARLWAQAGHRARVVSLSQHGAGAGVHGD